MRTESIERNLEMIGLLHSFICHMYFKYSHCIFACLRELKSLTKVMSLFSGNVPMFIFSLHSGGSQGAQCILVLAGLTSMVTPLSASGVL